MGEKKRIISIMTGLNPDEKQQAVLSEIFHVFNAYKHRFFMESLRNEELTEKEFRFREGKLDRRWSRSAEEDVKGMKESIQSNRENYIFNNKEKLKQTEKDIKIAREKYLNALKNKEAFSQKIPKLLSSLQHLYRKKARIENDIKQLQYDYDNKKFHICFGTKSLFKQQFKVDVDHSKWKNEWMDSRYHSFRLTGAKHETCGNLNAQLHYISKNNYSLKIRIPNCMEEKYGKYVTLNNISFYSKGRKKDISNREMMQYIIMANNFNDKNSPDRKPLTINVSKIKRKYRLTVQFTPDEVKVNTNSLKGVVGVDMNADNFSVADIDENGKIIETKIFKFDLRHKSSGQRENLIFHAMNKVVDFALNKGKDLIYEDLDFKRKKQQMRSGYSQSENHMLSSFAYSKMKEQLLSRCFKMGVKAHKINPAYTSLLGKLLHSKKYGLSTHESAAYTIARKFYKIKELVKSFITMNFHGKTFMFVIPEKILQSEGYSKLKKLKQWYKDLFKSQSKWKVYSPSHLNPS